MIKRFLKRYFFREIMEEMCNTVGRPIVVEIEKSSSMRESLGITEERAGELVDFYNTSKGVRKTQRIVSISKKCLHANELAYICYLAGHAHAEQS